MKYLKRGIWIIFLIWVLFSAEKSWAQIILEAPHSANESNYKWFNGANSNFEILSTDFFLEVSEPGVYYATFNEKSSRNNATGYFVLTICNGINSEVTIDLSLTECGKGEIRWFPLDFGSNLSPTVLATKSAIIYSATWVRKTSITKLAEITVMCIPNNTNSNIKDNLKIYNIITPNGDGYNDYLKVENIERYPENTIEIINRWGALVYEVKGYNNTSTYFNGFANAGSIINKNKKLPTGTYFYRLLYKDKNSNVVMANTGYLYLKD